MTAITPVGFTHGDTTIRTILIESEPWFVLVDLCTALEISSVARVAARLDEGVRSTHTLSTAGGPQRLTIVNEAGMYEVVIRSDKPRAAEFRRWITGTVLPEIRKTGSYNAQPALTGAELLAHAVIEAQQMLAAKDERIAELEPKAEVADRILTAEGDLSVADAAKSLTRAGIKVGQNRLFTLLADRYGWIYRAADNRWRVKQTAIESGWMHVIPQSHYHPRTGVLVLDPPQPRVTPKGLQRILADHGAPTLTS